MRTRPARDHRTLRLSLTMPALALVVSVLLAGTGPAAAQSIARAVQSGPAYLCPKASCPQAARGAPRAGSGVAVFEISGGFARISGYMDAATARAKYGMSSPVEGGSPVALWIPIDRLALAPSVTKKIEAEKQAEEARLKREAEEKKAAERQRRQKLSEEKRKAAEARKAEMAKAQAKPSATDKATAAKAEEKSAPATETKTKPAEKQKPAGKTAAAKPAESATPEPVPEKPATKPAPKQVPKRLTAQLKDRRLSSLPSKPGPALTMADVVAIRQKGLELLEAGECGSLKAGGAASTAGFLFVQCGGVSMGSGFTQFPRPAP